MKTPEELNALKADHDALQEKLTVPGEEELKQVTGGLNKDVEPKDRDIA